MNLCRTQHTILPMVAVAMTFGLATITAQRGGAVVAPSIPVTVEHPLGRQLWQEIEELSW